MKDNIVPFPMSNKPEETGAEEMPLSAFRKIMENRRNGLERLEEKVDGFGSSRMPSPEAQVEARLGDLESAFRATHTHLEALNALIDIVAGDLVSVMQEFPEIQKEQFKLAAHLETLLDVLREKGVVSEDEMKETWDRIIAAAQEPPTETDS